MKQNKAVEALDKLSESSRMLEHLQLSMEEMDDCVSTIRAQLEADQKTIEELSVALGRQTENISFILNRMEMPYQWYDKFAGELKQDLQALANTKGKTE